MRGEEEEEGGSFLRTVIILTAAAAAAKRGGGRKEGRGVTRTRTDGGTDGRLDGENADVKQRRRRRPWMPQMKVAVLPLTALGVRTYNFTDIRPNAVEIPLTFVAYLCYELTIH